MIPPPKAVENTKACDKDGRPIIFYHGTGDAFERFLADKPLSIGTHFGCPEQANYRIRYKPCGHIFPVYLKIDSPLNYVESDLGFEFPLQTAYLLKTGGNITSYEALAATGLTEDMTLVQAFLAEPTDEDEIRARNRRLEAVLLAKGIDGIFYSNTNEPRDKKKRNACLVLRTNQIFSAITGECLGGD